ncbi:hypothetical protein [Actinophytocola sp.]|uniref:hypothetical protein n=1 Tax=Actinophytocola sp. TaxID=1872138 RepID=UPI003D6A2388
MVEVDQPRPHPVREAARHPLVPDVCQPGVVHGGHDCSASPEFNVLVPVKNGRLCLVTYLWLACVTFP